MLKWKPCRETGGAFFVGGDAFSQKHGLIRISDIFQNWLPCPDQRSHELI